MKKKTKVIWIVILGAFIAVASWRIFVSGQTGMAFEQNSANQTIVVHIAGAVVNPGVVILPLDARMNDALAVAGLHEEADSEVINLAQKLKDGQKIYIPFKGEASEVLTEEAVDEDGGTAAAGTARAQTQAQAQSQPQGKININTAGSGQLQSLPGIGPAKAANIIAYRKENGLFVSIDELKNVTGIGEKTFESLADYITVGP
ncbi:MAG: helix-hairpin-helix domain-containing protein [Peptococcaceae bacterium]|jgi:competence protein ComEA|nr:helix-hairpin-helix domain-containing protein [Peptococcaceae bacterium]MDR2737225.1 helix-hairpin-helix domain-containing protein [Gracilibacteraceae bacterium]